MTREIFVRLDQKRVMADCAAAGFAISTIEEIPAGGVRVVLSSSYGAHQMRHKYKSQLITEAVTRERIRPRKPGW